jgi:hypothetical protein
VYQNGAEDDFHVKVVNTKEETTELLEAELDYLLEKEDLAYFRKRK